MGNITYKLEKKSFLLFGFTVFLSVFLVINSIFNKPHMLAWVSLLVSTLLFFGVYLFFNRKKILLFIIYIYQYLFIFSLFVEEDYLYLNNISYDFYSYLMLPFLIYSIALPSVFIERPNLHYLANSLYTKRLILFFFPLILFSIFYLLPYTFNTFIYGAENVRSGGADSEYWSNMPSNFSTTFSVGISMLYSLYFFLLFYVIAINASKKYFYICLLGILSGVIGGLVFATRDRFIYLFFYFVLFYWMWKPYLIKNNYFDKVKKYFWVLGLLFISFFAWITLDRFSSGFESFFRSSLFYFGTQPYIFSEIVANHKNFYGWAYNFPVFFEPQVYINRKPPYFWMWGTLFQNFYIMGGWFYCFILVFYHIIFSSFVFIFLRKYVWFYSIYLILYFQIVVQGVFYFNLGFKGGNLYIIIMLIIGIIMQLTLASRSRG